MSTNPGITAAYERALLKRGTQIIVRRVTGFAPNPTASFSAWVVALVTSVQPETTQPSEMGYASTKLGGISENDRQIILMTSDLQAARYPLPLRKNDKIIIVETGDELNIIEVDAYKREIAGAIELRAAGVQ